MELLEEVKKIFIIHNFGDISNCYRINVGFNNMVLSINDRYIFKICYNEDREVDFLREIDFYSKNSYDFIPKLITYDSTKKDFPFCYMVQEKIIGSNLYTIWSKLSFEEREKALHSLLAIMNTLHSKKVDPVDYIKVIDSTFNSYLGTIIKESILPTEKIDYLQHLKGAVYENYGTHRIALIHGDLQFNNVICLPNGEVKIVDFEYHEVAPIEKEFDSIFRFSENPQLFLQKGNRCEIDKEGFRYIRTFFEENCKEISCSPDFESHMLIYEILNSIRWITKYPDCSRYHEVLFEKSKLLLKNK